MIKKHKLQFMAECIFTKLESPESCIQVKKQSIIGTSEVCFFTNCLLKGLTAILTSHVIV